MVSDPRCSCHHRGIWALRRVIPGTLASVPTALAITLQYLGCVAEEFTGHLAPAVSDPSKRLSVLSRGDIVPWRAVGETRGAILDTGARGARAEALERDLVGY